MMQLKQIISILNEFNDISILRADSHKEDVYNYNPAYYHQLYYGKVMDVPEYLLEYYIVSNSLSAEIDETNYSYLTIVVVKDLPQK